MKDFLFPQPTDSKSLSLLLLCLRIFFGLMLMMHGLEKIYTYTEISLVFPDPLGIGGDLTLLCVICAEVLCTLGFMLGALYRLAMLPMIFVMAMAFFYIHNSNIFEGELAFIYLIVFVLMYISGPGEYSVDARIYQQIHAKDDEAYEY